MKPVVIFVLHQTKSSPIRRSKGFSVYWSCLV